MRLSRAVALVLPLSLFLAACQPGQQTDLRVPRGHPDAGEQLFEQEMVEPTCGACHTLQAAEWGGGFAPNLDLVQPGYERVLTAITEGPGAMPSYRGTLTEQQLRDVAAYVAQQVLAGQEDIAAVEDEDEEEEGG
jgi:cytochrome c6